MQLQEKQHALEKEMQLQKLQQEKKLQQDVDVVQLQKEDLHEELLQEGEKLHVDLQKEDPQEGDVNLLPFFDYKLS